MENRNMILNESMKSLFLKLGLPAIIGMLILQVYNLTDAIFVGQFVSKEAVGAIGIAYIAALFNQCFFILVGSGAGVELSMAIGKKRYDVCNRLFNVTTVLTFFVSSIFAVFLFLFTGPIVSLVTNDSVIKELTVRYLKILSMGMPLLSMSGAWHSLLRSEGQIKESSFYMFISIMINILMDFFFIVILKMGIEGAAIATVISQGIGFILVVVHYIYKKSIIRVSISRPDFTLLPAVLKNGSGQGLMHISSVVSVSLLYNALGRIGGNEHVIVMTATLRLWEYFFFIILGASFGMQTTIGVNYGAENFRRVKEAFIFYVRFGLIVSVTVWILFMVLPGFFLSWFITDPQVVKAGENLFRICNSIYFMLGLTTMMSMLFAAVGKGLLSSVYVMMQQIVFFLPLILILPLVFGIMGVWMTMPAAGILSFAVELVLFYAVWTELGKKETELCAAVA